MREPTQERARKRVAAILDAAADLIAHEGVEALTTTSLARAADVPVGSVYQYFDDADDVLHTLQHRLGAELVAACHAALDAALKGAPDGLDWRETTRLSFDTYWEELLCRPVYVALLRDASRRRSFSEAMSTGDSDIGDLFRRGLVLGGAALPKDRAHVIVETALGALSALTDLAMLADDEAEREMRRREMLRMIELYLGDAIEAGCRTT
ncbi:MAG: TetR/AcrR family transcriptional regulator [Parvibaculaceae bacterium]